MMQISLEEAYKEACTALGEAIVRERLTIKALETINAEEPGAVKE